MSARRVFAVALCLLVVFAPAAGASLSDALLAAALLGDRRPDLDPGLEWDVHLALYPVSPPPARAPESNGGGTPESSGRER